MPNETIQIFNGTAQSNQINLSDGFIKANYLYLVNNTPEIDLELDISLQIYLTPTITRAVRLENDNILNSVSISLIPHELFLSPFNMRVALITQQDINISITAVRNECCGEKELEDVKNQLNRIEAYNIVSTIADVVTAVAAGFTAFTIGSIALPMLAPNILRGGFSILAPAVGGILEGGAQIFFDEVPQLVLNAGQFYVDETLFTGAVSAISTTGNPIELAIKEFL